mgnify:CR=1 FL=1
MISIYLLLDYMVIFVIYISAFSSFISSAEGKRRSSTQAKRKQHDLKGQKFLEAARPEGGLLAKLVSIRFHIRYFLDLPLSMCSYVKSFFMKKVSKYHFFG